MYTAAVLTQVSHARLMKELKRELEIPSGYEILAHHMTINMGPCQDTSMLGADVSLMVDEIASDENVIAVKVNQNGFHKTANKVPHITVAVNRAGGGKPVMSNNLTNWKKINPILLFATIETCQ